MCLRNVFCYQKTAGDFWYTVYFLWKDSCKLCCVTLLLWWFNWGCDYQNCCVLYCKVPICIALYNEQLAYKALRYGTCWRGITQFYLPSTCLSTSGMNHTCLYSPAAEHHRTLAGTHFTAPQRVEGWVDVGGWLHTEIKCRRWESNPDTVTHPSTNRAQRRLTSLIKINVLPLRQTATVCQSDMQCSHIWAVLEDNSWFTVGLRFLPGFYTF